MTRRALKRRSRGKREEGIALILVMTVIALMTIFVVDMQENTSVAFQVATAERDRLKAEYIAKSGMNLTRLLIAREPQIRNVIGPLFTGVMAGRPPPQLNVWAFANAVFAPFNNMDAAKAEGSNIGIDFSQMEGLKDMGGSFDVVAFPENGKLNVNNALFITNDIEAKQSMAMLLFALTGGQESPQSPYDPMFEQRDADDQFTSRIDIISALTDWWDIDQTRSVYDPTNRSVTEAGGEDDIYSRFKHPYKVKNAPYDSLEELRLIRGVGDDFWATFVEPDPEDPTKRQLTVYASGAVNINEAPPQVILARLCSIAGAGQPLCTTADGITNFLRTFSLLKLAKIPLFSRPADFLDFVEGKGGPTGIYSMVTMFFPSPDGTPPFVPMVIPADQRSKLEAAFIASAAIFTIQSTATVNKTQLKLSAVVNFHNRWTPPPPNAGTMPGLGVVQHYRVD